MSGGSGKQEINKRAGGAYLAPKGMYLTTNVYLLIKKLKAYTLKAEIFAIFEIFGHFLENKNREIV